MTGYSWLRRQRWLVLAIAALFVMGAECNDGGGAPGGPQVPGPGDAECRVTADYPHESDGKPGWIDGKVRASCTAVIDSLTIEAKLQRQVRGDWVDVATASPRVVSPVIANRPYTVRVDLACPLDGSGRYTTAVYRTAGRGFGVYGGVPNKSANWVYNPQVGVEVTCRGTK
jgi:hypothetical protein